jgi:hypothetical protein
MVTRTALAVSDDIGEVLRKDIERSLFPPHLELVPQLNELYEVKLAFYESQLLNDDGIVRQGAYFARVGDRSTRHFLMCRGEPLRLAGHSSSRLKAFFRTNQFKTGYATHGLFPYRGKFHPQMVKAILNIMGLKPGETVLDPMMGSGTTLIEATLMGIDSIGVDASPFCQFMAQAKLDGLSVPLNSVDWAAKHAELVFDYFARKSGHPQGRSARGKTRQLSLNWSKDKDARSNGDRTLARHLDNPKAHNYLRLAYLDSAGYSIRSQRRTPLEQFRAILERYAFVARKTQGVLEGVESELGTATPLEGDARALPLQDARVDGILFSPPYSFAIDYIANDAFHLRTMGVDLVSLKDGMIGLRGRALKEKYEHYIADMRLVLAECARVLRPKRFCTIVVGTNNNQLAKIFDTDPQEVRSMSELLVDLAGEFGMKLTREIERQITGMANTMRSEHIIVLRRD